MNKDDSCMLKEITDFLIKVGEHCLECEGKTIVEPQKPAIKEPVKTEKQVSNLKISYLEKWIQKGVFTVFTLEQFFKDYPRQRENKRLNRNISKLINDGKILQLDKEKFTVIKRGEKKKNGKNKK